MYQVYQRFQASGALIHFQRAPSLSACKGSRFLALSITADVLIFAWRPVNRVSLLINYYAVNLQLIKSDRFTLIFNCRKSKLVLSPYLEMPQWSSQCTNDFHQYLWHILYLVVSMHLHTHLRRQTEIRRLNSSLRNVDSYLLGVRPEWPRLSEEREYCRSRCSSLLARRVAAQRCSPPRGLSSDQGCRDHGIAWSCKETARIPRGC